MVADTELEEIFADQDLVIEVQNGEPDEPKARSHIKSISLLFFAAIFPVSLALIWISIPTSQHTAYYYFIKLPIAVIMASLNCFYIACDMAGAFQDKKQKWIAALICSIFTTVITVAITIGITSAVGELQKFWIIPISFLIGYSSVSVVLFVICIFHPAFKSQNHPTMHLKVYLIMIVVHLQLFFSLVFGWVFTMLPDWFYQLLMCAGYPIGILLFKVVLIVVSADNVNLQITSQVMSLAYAALPYRFLFPALSTHWYAACLVLGVEISYKWILFGLDLKRKVMTNATLQAIQRSLCCFNSSSGPQEDVNKDRTRLNYVLFTYQTYLDCSFALFIMMLFSYINNYKEASTQTGLPNLTDSTFSLAYLFYPLGFLVSLLTFISIVMYHQYSYRNDNQVEHLLSWKNMWMDDMKLIHKFATQIMLSCGSLYLILLWSTWEETDPL